MAVTKPIKMVTIDLDGTLLRSDGTVSAQTIATLQEARRRGVIVAIATGRMFATAKPYGELLQLGDSPMLLFAGGLIQTIETKRKLFEQAIAVEDALALLQMARQRGWQMQTYIDDVLRVAVDEPWIRNYEAITQAKAVVCGDAFYQTVPAGPNKILSRGRHDELVERQRLIEAAFPNRFHVCFSDETFLEIMPQGVDKGMGIRNLGKVYQIGVDQIMAIGDSQNDIDMLQVAGLPIVMENAADEIKQYGAYVTSSNDTDGVAAAIEKFVFTS